MNLRHKHIPRQESEEVEIQLYFSFVSISRSV